MGFLDSEHRAQLSEVSSEASRGYLTIPRSGGKEFDYIINVANGTFKYKVHMVRASGKLIIMVTHDFNTEGDYCITAMRPKHQSAVAPMINRFDVLDWGADLEYYYDTSVEEFCIKLNAEAYNGEHNLKVYSKYSTGNYLDEEVHMISTFQDRFTMNSVDDGECNLPIAKVGIETRCNVEFTMVTSDAECSSDVECSLNIDTPLGKGKKKCHYGQACILQVRNDKEDEGHEMKVRERD